VVPVRTLVELSLLEEVFGLVRVEVGDEIESSDCVSPVPVALPFTG